MATDNPNAPKAPTFLRIKLRYEDVTTFVEKFAANVGRNGLFIRSKTPKPVDSELRFEIRLADDTAVVVGMGKVRWIREPDPTQPRFVPGMGVEFTRVTKESREVLLKILEYRRAHGMDATVAIPVPADDEGAARPVGGARGEAVPMRIDPVPSAPLIDSAPIATAANALVTANLSEPMSAPIPVAVPSSVSRPNPLPPRSKPNRIGPAELLARTAATAAPAEATEGSEEILAFLSDALDVGDVLKRARSMIEPGEADGELAKLLEDDAAPTSITVDDASAGLASMFGARTASRRVAAPRLVADGTRTSPVVPAAEAVAALDAAPDLDAARASAAVAPTEPLTAPPLFEDDEATQLPPAIVPTKFMDSGVAETAPLVESAPVADAVPQPIVEAAAEGAQTIDAVAPEPPLFEPLATEPSFAPEMEEPALTMAGAPGDIPLGELLDALSSLDEQSPPAAATPAPAPSPAAPEPALLAQPPVWTGSELDLDDEDESRRPARDTMTGPARRDTSSPFPWARRASTPPPVRGASPTTPPRNASPTTPPRNASPTTPPRRAESTVDTAQATESDSGTFDITNIVAELEAEVASGHDGESTIMTHAGVGFSAGALDADDFLGTEVRSLDRGAAPEPVGPTVPDLPIYGAPRKLQPVPRPQKPGARGAARPSGVQALDELDAALSALEGSPSPEPKKPSRAPSDFEIDIEIDDE